MVGKLNIDDGLNYAFDIRRAKEVAEGVERLPTITGLPVGPYTSDSGAPYWLRTNINTGRAQVGFNIDSDPDPDIWRRLTAFLKDASVDLAHRNDVKAQARALGWDGVS